MNYYQYSITLHKIDTKEKVDHGILGGRLSFDRLIKKYIKKQKEDIEELKTIKEACLAIAQHNIFKSSNKNNDKLYISYGLQHLTSDSKFRINNNTPLLYFLSLIDTVECVKKLSREISKDAYLESQTVLSNMKIELLADSITLNYDGIVSAIRKKEKNNENARGLMDSFNSYYDAVLSLNQWTDFNAKKIHDSDNETYKLQIDFNNDL